MKVTPVLMDGESMVALRARRKTQTRRTRGLAKFNEDPNKWTLEEVRELAGPCLYGEAGDLCWCKETWLEWVEPTPYPGFWYRSDYPCKAQVGKSATGFGAAVKWKSSMFMPRRVSRVTLRLTGVEVERVQGISIEDIDAEGCPLGQLLTPTLWWPDRWDGINLKKCPYASNPYVWALKFEVLLENVDSVIERMEAVR